MSYSKEQLIKAQQEYNLRWKENPNMFLSLEDNIFEIEENNNSVATKQIEYLISIIEENEN